MNKRILIVDDEKPIINALKRLLRNQPYTVLTANSGMEALEILAKTDIQVVISDFRMPGMTGGELLVEIHRRYPDVVGIILTGYADYSAVLEALNSGAVYKFLMKPWQEESLLLAIRDAFDCWLSRLRKDGVVRLVQDLCEPIIEISETGVIRYTNNAAIQLLTLPGVELIGQSLKSLIPSLDDQQFNCLLSNDAASIDLAFSKQFGSIRIDVQTLERGRKVLTLHHVTPSVSVPKGVLNREEALQWMEQRIEKHDAEFTLIYFDIDRFRNFIHSIGHTKTDRLLKQIAGILYQSRPDNSVFCHINGDEFVLFLETVNHADETRALIDQFLSPFRQLVLFEQHPLYISISAGFAHYPFDGVSSEEILNAAYAAVTAAKMERGLGYVCYTPSMSTCRQTIIEIQSDLYNAITNQDLYVVYQPKYCVKSQRVVGAEALVRWNAPVRGALGPDVFIPIAEESGLIVPLGEYVFEMACKTLFSWEGVVDDEFVLSINLSGRQLRDVSLLTAIKRIVTSIGLKYTQLELELTESFLIQDIDFSIGILEKLKNLGIRIALDDFGIAYSSLNYLSRLPIDTLKIDKVFVDLIPDSADKYKLLENVIRMSHDMGFKVVAEGVETAAQYESLNEMGCDQIQGYLISPPVSESEFRHFLSGKLPQTCFLGN